MNPPSALYGAMNKERKPFTYTPGGLNLSEIKSERMAKRLMRNAMSQGVPETPAQTVQSPPATGIPNAIPNFNCLPVQVFPTFQLPANPKSLLRTRSNPNQVKETSSYLAPPSSILDIDDKLTGPWQKTGKSLPCSDSKYGSCNNSNTNNISSSINFSNNHTLSGNLYGSTNYGSNENRNVLLPDKYNDVKVCQTRPKGETNVIEKDNNALSDIFVYNSTINEKNINISPKLDIDIKSIPVTLASTLQDTDATNNYEQKEVKIVQKQSKKENKTNENGDAETDVVIKLPSKSSAAKTETKVEISKKILPDGTVEETKITTTKTTIDGKTEITTKTETKTIPKEVDQDEIEEIEEEEEENQDVVIEENISEDEDAEEKASNREICENGDEVEENSDEVESKDNKTDIKSNGHIITGEEKVESSTTKKVVVVQSMQDDSEEEIEEEEEEIEVEDEGDVAVEEVVILRKPESKLSNAAKNAEVGDDNDISENVEVANKENIENQEDEIEQDEEEKDKEEDEDEERFESSTKKQIEEENNDIEETKQKGEIEEQNIVEEPKQPVKEDVDEDLQEEVEDEFEEAEDTEMKEEISEEVSKDELDNKTEKPIDSEDKSEKQEVENLDKHIEEKVVESEKYENIDEQNDKEEIVHEIKVQSEPRVSFREPSIPLDKVDDVEIKPIGPAQEIIKKSHTEIITTTTDKPSGALSTQTEYNKIENIVTVNRTTKILDHAYEQMQPSVPTLKTYFSSNDDRILSTPQPLSKPYQPIYPSEPQPERRHSLLLDRLSVDRQLNASDIYQNNYQYTNQNYEQNQWSEPQSEILTVSNVKPSTISKDKQWYHQINRENTVSSGVPPAPLLPSQQLRQTYAQPQPQIQIQQPEQQYQSFTQPQYKPKPEFQPYVETNLQNTYRSSNDYQQNSYSNCTPSATWANSNFDSKPVSLAPSTHSNQYSSFKKESTDNYQKSTQFSSYVPPPWEQDASYVPETQNYYQPPQSSIPVTPSINQAWTPKPTSKFSKNTPTSYIPPAPNQSFVKPVIASDQSKLPGRKTYYSEYERRYISVPESTYIPGETKFQPQPDPSPQYYYDNNEPAEVVEPQWRKELREFTEKSSDISNQYEKSSVRPPWEEDPKYNAPTEYIATATPTWTQTLRPRTWRERSYEPEYIGSNAQQTNTLGRGRPQSSYLKSNICTIPERPRGVSVDRYNPNNYQPPLASEHPPVQSHTLNPNIHPKTYHNPNVPVYHSRASAEPREHVPTYPQSRPRVESKAPPVQSRSFKYLQWITGTED